MVVLADGVRKKVPKGSLCKDGGSSYSLGL